MWSIIQYGILRQLCHHERKAIELMKKNNKAKLLRSSLICLVVAAMTVGFLPMPRGQVSGYEASRIELLENAPKPNLQDYLDQSVLFQLPAAIKDDENISVIITVGESTLMDAYEGTDKTMSFTEIGRAHV